MKTAARKTIENPGYHHSHQLSHIPGELTVCHSLCSGSVHKNCHSCSGHSLKCPLTGRNRCNSAVRRAGCSAGNSPAQAGWGRPRSFGLLVGYSRLRPCPRTRAQAGKHCTRRGRQRITSQGPRFCTPVFLSAALPCTGPAEPLGGLGPSLGDLGHIPCLVCTSVSLPSMGGCYFPVKR